MPQRRKFAANEAETADAYGEEVTTSDGDVRYRWTSTTIDDCLSYALHCLCLSSFGALIIIINEVSKNTLAA